MSYPGMAALVRNVSVQQGQTALGRPATQVITVSCAAPGPSMRTLDTSALQAMHLQSGPGPLRSQRTSSPKAWMAAPPVGPMMSAPVAMHGSAGPRAPSPDETFVGMGGAWDKQAVSSRTGPVRMQSGNPQKALSPSRTHLGSSRTSVLGSIQVAVDTVEFGVSCAGLHHDCATCWETRRRGYINVKLQCGHMVRAQIVEADMPGPCDMAMSPHARAGIPPHSIVRQVSGVRNPPPASGISSSTMGSMHPSAPLSPPRGPPGGLVSPSSPQVTPATMYRTGKATSSLTSLNIPRESTGPVENQPQTCRSSVRGGGGGGEAAAERGSVTSRGEGEARRERGSTGGVEKARRGGAGSSAVAGGSGSGGMGAVGAGEPTGEQRGGVLEAPPRQTTTAEVVTDCRGDVLHKNTNVILLSPHQTPGTEQQLRVRGQIVGTYWDEIDTGPHLSNASEVQVMVTYIDAMDRGTVLLFPTKQVSTFADTESDMQNVIRWKATMCKVGKKFA